MRKRYAILSVLIVGAATALAAGINPLRMFSSLAPGTLHVWGSDEVVTSTHLNGNFTELNTTKLGGGVQATNSDISASAAIAHSKLATPALVPKAWAAVTANCDGAAAAGTDCTVGDGSGVPLNGNAVESTGAAGVYRVNLSYTPANANFAVLVTAHTSAVYCNADTRATSAPHFLIRCWDGAVPAAANNVQFSLLVMDT